jgi:hypothetical protein
MFKFIFLFLFMTPALAVELNCSEGSFPLESFGTSVLNILPKKECPSNDEVILKQVEAEYESFYGSERQTKKYVKGFSLVGSTKELKLAREMLGDQPPKNWNKAASGCETLQCAFTKLFGSKEAAMQMFNIHAKSNYILSLDQSINQNLADQIWSPREVRELDAAISKMPSVLKNLPRLDKINRMGDGLRRKQHNASVAAFASVGGESQLVIYDNGLTSLTKNKNPYDKISWPQEVLIHELCHHYDYKGYHENGTMYSEQRNSSFARLSGWREETGSKGQVEWKYSPNAKFVSAYAQTQPAEDFAETCMNYVLNPKRLKEKAPNKYAYMKRHIFNQQDFSQKPWVNSEESKWPELAKLLDDEKICHAKLNECVKNISYSKGSGTFCHKEESSRLTDTYTITYTSACYSRPMVRSLACFEKFKQDRIKEIDEELSNSKNYCSLGGSEVIHDARNKVCQESGNILDNSLERAAAVDIGGITSLCESKNDFTTECVSDLVVKTLEMPQVFFPALKGFIEGRVPDRFAALEGKLKDIGTKKFLKPCLAVVSEINSFSSYFSYGSNQEGYSQSYLSLGRDYNYSEQKDTNLACAQEISKVFESDGVKIPTSGKVTKLLKYEFRSELVSFENEVLSQIKSATEKCLFTGCKVKKINALLEDWEERSPTKRAGLATKEFAQELQKKFHSYD